MRTRKPIDRDRRRRRSWKPHPTRLNGRDRMGSPAGGQRAARSVTTSAPGQVALLFREER